MNQNTKPPQDLGQTISEMTNLVRNWPAVPTRERLIPAHQALEEIQTAMTRPGDAHVYGQRPGTITITDSEGKTHLFDNTHEDTIRIMPRNQAQKDAAALHDCCQAVRFSEAAANLMTRVNPNPPKG